MVWLLMIGASFVAFVVQIVRGKGGQMILWLVFIVGGLLFVVVSLFVPLVPALRHCF
jgi:hypothetical protein